MYKVYDSLGNYLKTFSSWEAAQEFKIMCGRYDWKIK